MRRLSIFITILILFISVLALARDIPKKILILEIFSGATSGSGTGTPSSSVILYDANGIPVRGSDSGYIYFP